MMENEYLLRLPLVSLEGLELKDLSSPGMVIFVPTLKPSSITEILSA